MSYVDGFVLAVNDVAAYRKMATQAGRIWMKHGALQYFECVGDDVDTKHGTPFPKVARQKPGEITVFAFIVFKNKAHRNKVNAAVMKDPEMMPPSKEEQKNMPFDMKRMSYGGFKTIVALPS